MPQPSNLFLGRLPTDRRKPISQRDGRVPYSTRLSRLPFHHPFVVVRGSPARESGIYGTTAWDMIRYKETFQYMDVTSSHYLGNEGSRHICVPGRQRITGYWRSLGPCRVPSASPPSALFVVLDAAMFAPVVPLQGRDIHPFRCVFRLTSLRTCIWLRAL